MLRPINIKAPERTEFIIQIEDALNENALKSLSALSNEENFIKVIEEESVISQAIGTIIRFAGLEITGFKMHTLSSTWYIKKSRNSKLLVKARN